MDKANPSARDIIDALDRREIMARLDVSKQTVSSAYKADRLPASWFPVIEDMCAGAGIACPMTAFSFKAAS